jgi:hypothetical protein
MYNKPDYFLDFKKTNVNKIINQLLNSKNRKKLWNHYDRPIKALIIKQIWKNKREDYLELTSQLLKFIRDGHKKDQHHVRGMYVNLLCILLARSHNFKYLQDIVKTKNCGDLFFYVDSNLLFEFSPKGERETCMKDIIEFIKDYDCKKKWFQRYKEFVEHYSKHYDEKLVIQQWSKYKTKEFERLTDD